MSRRGGPRTRSVVGAVCFVALLASGCSDDVAPSPDAGEDERRIGSVESAPPTTATTLPPFEPALFDERGPHAIGVTTLSLPDREVEVWYPVAAASTEGLEPDSYSSLEPYPEDIRSIPALADTEQIVVTDAYRDVPVAADLGPRPVVLYSHGFGGFRKTATFNALHLASWGMIVASTDHRERDIAAVSTGVEFPTEGERPDVRDLRMMLDLLIEQDATATSVLAGSVDAARVGAMGHSAGASAAVGAALADDRVDTLVSWASGSDPENGVPTVPALFVVADGDVAIAPAETRVFYDALPGQKRFVVLDNAGHNSFTDQCADIYDRDGLGDIAAVLPIPENLLALGEDGCRPELFTDPRTLWPVINHFTVAHLLEVFDEGEAADRRNALDPRIAVSFEGNVEGYQLGDLGG